MWYFLKVIFYPKLFLMGFDKTIFPESEKYLAKEKQMQSPTHRDNWVIR